MRKLLIFCLVLSVSVGAFAQDTLDVPYLDGDGNLIINALTTYVAADTNDNGEQLHSVYKLERGGTYMYNEAPVIKNPIHIVADKPGDTDETKPPLLIVTTDSEGEVPYANNITTYADLTLKNIAMTTTSVDGIYSWANAIILSQDGLTLTMDGCVFTMIGWGMIEAYTKDTKIFVKNCTVRNATVYDAGDEWCPFFIESGGAEFDTLSFTNNTIFNLQGAIVNVGGTDVINNFIFDHNTLVNVVKGFTPLRAHYNTIVSNNIFYNVNPHSVTLQQVLDGEDQVYPSVISADTLLGNEPDAPDSVESLMAESDRSYVLKNNCYAWSQNVKDYWADYDSVAAVKWMNDVAKGLFEDDENYPNFYDEGNVNIDPGFSNADCTDDLVAQMKNHRDNGTFGFWGFAPNTEFTMPDYFLEYPYPEDLTYSADLTSTDGFHVGSLQWYPEELAQYEAVYVSVDDNENELNTADNFVLEQNYPNPFNPSTRINYTINNSGRVNLVVYNVLGQKIRTLVSNQSATAGSHSAVWNGMNEAGNQVANGVYFYKLQVGNQSTMKKMMFLK